MQRSPKVRPGPRPKIVIIPWVVNGRNFCGRWPIERERKSGFHLKNPQIYGKNLNIQSAQSTSSFRRSACHPDFPQSWKNGISGSGAEEQIGMNEKGSKVEADVAMCPLLSLFRREENRDGDTDVPYALHNY